MRKTRFELKEPKRGQPVKADDIAAIVRAVAGESFASDGITDEFGTVTGYRPRTHRRPPIEVVPVEDVPAYSLFGAWGALPKAEPHRVRVARCGLTYPGSYLGLMTNGSIPLIASRIGTAHFIDFYEPVEIRVTGPVPTVGGPCGIHPGNYGISLRGMGMVCLSPVAADGRVVAMRTREPVAVLGKVVEAVTAADPCQDHLGHGIIAAYFHEGPYYPLVQAVNPETGAAPWTFDVYNMLQEPIPVGKLVKATDSLGIGLVVDVTGDWVCYGSSSSSGPSSSSSSGSSSDSSSSSSLSSIVSSSPSSSLDSSSSSSLDSSSSSSSSSSVTPCTGDPGVCVMHCEAVPPGQLPPRCSVFSPNFCWILVTGESTCGNYNPTAGLCQCDWGQLPNFPAERNSAAYYSSCPGDSEEFDGEFATVGCCVTPTGATHGCFPWGIE